MYSFSASNRHVHGQRALLPVVSSNVQILDFDTKTTTGPGVPPTTTSFGNLNITTQLPCIESRLTLDYSNTTNVNSVLIEDGYIDDGYTIDDERILSVSVSVEIPLKQSHNRYQAAAF